MAAVFSILPQAGLGNKLFVWARGAAFAEINGFPHYTLGWSHLSLGAVRRAANRRPLYGRSFRGGLTGLLNSWRFIGPIEKEPVLEAVRPSTYVFSEIPSWRDYFVGLREHRDAIRRRFFNAYRLERPIAPSPFIALHIRLGDFREPDSRPFAAQGSTRTPLGFFIDVVCEIRKMVGYGAPVRIFSDGSNEELSDVLQMPNTVRCVCSTDAEELVLMSTASAIVTSAGSTFSLWAGFLGDGVLIHHPEHFHQNVRPGGSGWEGPWFGTNEPMHGDLLHLFDLGPL